MFVRTKKRDDKTYLMIVESKRVGARIEQITLASLGRLDKLLENGQFDALLTSLGRFSEKLAVLGAHERGETITAITRRIGPALVFERLWRELGVGGVIRELAAERKFGFELERAIFLPALHRLFDPGSDRQADKWKETHAITGAANTGSMPHSALKHGACSPATISSDCAATSHRSTASGAGPDTGFAAAKSSCARCGTSGSAVAAAGTIHPNGAVAAFGATPAISPSAAGISCPSASRACVAALDMPKAGALGAAGAATAGAREV